MRALLVAYYFPPKGGAGTQRFAKFCKYLPLHGVEPTVLTVDEGATSQYAPHDDASLLGDTRGEVVRVPVPARASFRQRLQRRLRLHIDDDEWAAAAGARAVAEARARRSEVVVTTLSPYACFRIGERVQRELGLPWVVDLRDPWALDAWRQHPSMLHAWLDLRRLRHVLRRADFVIANVPAARDAFVALGADPARTVVIPNGFDAEDFATGPPAADRTQFRLVHLGTFHPADVAPGLTTNRLLAVRHRQMEPLGRTGFYLLHALAKWRQRHVAPDVPLRLHLYGRTDPTHARLIADLRLGDLVSTHGYLPHRESIAALQAADAVFVPLHGLPPGDRALVVPGKLYEALASERPVLGALPAGDGADLVRALEAGSVVPPHDIDGLAAALQGLVAAWQAGRPLRGCRRDRLGVFTRRHLTMLLVQVLEAAVARRPAVEVEDPWRALRVTPGT